jgi:hypothetical protein
MPKRKIMSAAADFIDNAMKNPCRTAQRQISNHILFEQFQTALPPERIGIILRANWHRPGGCQPMPKRELPP